MCNITAPIPNGNEHDIPFWLFFRFFTFDAWWYIYIYIYIYICLQHQQSASDCATFLSVGDLLLTTLSWSFIATAMHQVSLSTDNNGILPFCKDLFFFLHNDSTYLLFLLVSCSSCYYSPTCLCTTLIFLCLVGFACPNLQHISVWLPFLELFQRVSKISGHS